MAQPNIVILDEEQGQQVGTQLKAILEQKKRYQVNLRGGLIGDVRNAVEAEMKRPSSESGAGHSKDLIESIPRLVIPVVPRSEERARQVLSELRSVGTQIPVLPVVRSEVLIEGFDSRLVSAQDFLVTPLREAEVHARVSRLTGGQAAASSPGVVEACGLAQIIGEDPAMVALKRKIRLVAQFESTVLLTGETGTGKERVARALHYCSHRAGKPFLPVNCGAIPVDLFENELYGHQKGAFTGAVVSQPGLIAEAEGGTLFLDEIETLSLSSQVKLLRFLQDQTYYAVGSARPRQANVWILASSNVELPLKIQERTFREDLFYRLAVISLNLPPLRQRRADIPLLAAHFWNLYGPKAGRSDRLLSAEVMEALCQHSWPGNIRELENVIQQLAVLTESQIVQPEDLPIPRFRAAAESRKTSFAQRKAQAIEDFERGYVTELLRIHRGNVTRAAQEARKDRRAFGRLIKKYRIPKH